MDGHLWTVHFCTLIDLDRSIWSEWPFNLTDNCPLLTLTVHFDSMSSTLRTIRLEDRPLWTCSTSQSTRFEAVLSSRPTLYKAGHVTEWIKIYLIPVASKRQGLTFSSIRMQHLQASQTWIAPMAERTIAVITKIRAPRTLNWKKSQTVSILDGLI